MLEIFIDCLIICLILSIDVFLIGFNYGISKIKVPFLSIVSITLINFIVIGIGCILSFFISNIIPDVILDYISIALLFSLGVYNLIKMIMKKDKDKSLDKNDDKILSPVECLMLAFVLTPDGFCASLSCGNDYRYIFTFLGLFILTTFLSILISSMIGYKLSKKIKYDLSWLSPTFLIIYSIVKLILLLI